MTFNLFLAGFVLMACQNTENSQNTSLEISAVDRALPIATTIVAKVGPDEILYKDVRDMALTQGVLQKDAAEQDMPPVLTTAQFMMALDSLIDQKLLAQDARRSGIDKTDEAVRRLEMARERLLSSMRLETHIRDTVTEDAMRKLYDTQAALADLGDEIRARHIILESEEDAIEVIKQLENDGDFEALAADLSLDVDTRDRGGDLGYFTFDVFTADFARPVFAGKKGQRLSPFETGKGWHVVEIISRRRPGSKSYEESREALRNFLTFDAIQTLMEDLRAQGSVARMPVEMSATPNVSTHSPDK